MLANMKAALAARRLRQADLAMELRVSAALLSDVIYGRVQLAPHLKTRAAEMLQADAEWLFQDTKIIPPLRTSTETQPAAAMACAGREV
jgi:transcriptional regulator with XRE-family HTH domain